LVPEKSLPSWASADGPDRDVAVSTRARLARNLREYSFPHRASETERREVAERIRAAIGLVRPDAEAIAVWKRPLAEQRELVETQRCSPLMADGTSERWVILAEGGDLSLLINEEDHLRLQIIAPGCQPVNALARAEALAAELDRSLGFARNTTLGFLTASLSNVGTGLRLSVLLHLPALAFEQSLSEKLRAVQRIDGTVRGVHGEGTKSAGALYQVSHATTLGHSSEYFGGIVTGGAGQLILDERAARVRLAAESPRRILSDAERAIQTIRTTEHFDAETALRELSKLRLSAILGQRLQPDAGCFAALTLKLRTSGHFDATSETIWRTEALKALVRTL
jgi:protein arginine kinase